MPDSTLNDIKHIIFDLGGVLLNIDYQLTETAFKTLGMQDFNQIYSQSKQDGLFDDFEIGKINRNNFVEELIKRSKLNLEPLEVINAWNSMLLDFPMKRVELLRKLKAKYDLYLLSNTNEIHLKEFHKIFDTSFNIHFDSLFDKAYYSNVLGMRKPNAGVFEHILNEQDLGPEQVLFIDDSIQHVTGARELGIKGHLLEKGRDVSNLLEELGILT